MADFVAVLKKTIDGLKNNTPEMREKVYEKARATIEAKLEAISPPPPKAAADRQRKALEDAIVEVEQEYSAPEAIEDEAEAEDKAFDEVFTSFAAEEPSQPEPVEKDREPVVAAPPPPPPREARPEPMLEDDEGPAPIVADRDRYRDEDDGGEEDFIEDEERRARGRRSYGTIAAIAAAALIIVVGAAAAWMSRDTLGALVGLGPDAETVSSEPEAGAAVVEDTGGEAAAEPEAPASDSQKFTQRLTEEGEEIDPGPASGGATVGEGTSIAAATQSSTEGGGEAAEASPAGESAATAGDGQLPVGQQAIFYEERTSSAAGTAQQGATVWSLVEESPGGDQPPEPAIRAEVTVPDKDIQVRVTIRRNVDQSLPASHIIEMIFLTPEGFGGGGIENVLRVTMKESEQDPGNPLFGIPAKIADGFFLVALSDSPAEAEANTALLRRQGWMDIPVVYKSGRRALVTLEKGIPGEQVFNQALEAWQNDSSG